MTSLSREIMLETFLFYFFAVCILLFAIGVVTSRSAVYAVLCLVAAMAMMSGLFVLLKAFFVATVLILVYAGAILVLFLFVVMMIDFRKLTHDWPSFKYSPILGLGICALLFTQFYRVINTVPSLSNDTAAHGTVEAVGRSLFSDYLLPFELTSVLILAAVVSVVVLAKKDAKE